MNIDVICYTKTATDHLYRVCRNTLMTLRDSEKDHKFIIHLYENNPNSPYDFSKMVDHYEVYDEPFAYCKFNNRAYPHVTGDWVMVINNDLRFERGWFSKILEVHNKRPDIESFAPKCPVLYMNNFDYHFVGTNEDYHESYKVTEFVSGWCLLMKRRVWDAIYPWDERFRFYYTDNDYAERLKELGVKHALVRDSIVIHLGSQTTTTVSEASIWHEEEKMFRTKWNIWH